LVLAVAIEFCFGRILVLDTIFKKEMDIPAQFPP